MRLVIFLLAAWLGLLAFGRDYPAHWWEPVPKEGAPSWEILPQEAGPGEVILSKRNELGLLSNFTVAPFRFRGTTYQSVEGLWQMMKYPEGPDDPRAQFPGAVWPHMREEVAAMSGFDAKKAGDAGSKVMSAMGINWVTFEGERLPYRIPEKGRHFSLIRQATWEKVLRNDEVRKVLLRTGSLKLRPDHHQGEEVPPAWRYHEIAMDIRDQLRAACAVPE